MSELTAPPHSTVSTGITGLDDILMGGLPAHRLYLVEGEPGAGKTTLALQFLLAGARLGERVLYVTLSETAEELRGVATSHGMSLEGVEVYELNSREQLDAEADNTLFHPSEVELVETTDAIFACVEKSRPARIAFDSLSELRLLAQSTLRYRRQILALKQFLVGRACTVLLMDDRTVEKGDPQLQSIVHGVVELQVSAPAYGAERRRLIVRKLRGVSYRGGYHDYRIVRGGLEVAPRLVAREHAIAEPGPPMESGLAEVDSLVGGGLDPGTGALFMGPAGSGKSALASCYVHAAAARGEKAAIFCFDESIETLLTRAAALSVDLRPYVASKHVCVEQVDPASLTPGEFAARVCKVVDEGVRMIVIDTLNGYLHSMPESQFLTAHLHELLAYLGQRGVLTILVVAQHGLLGSAMQSPIDVSYLADTVVLFRFYEWRGEVRKAISVVKRRRGSHERTIRELRLEHSRIHVGEPLRRFRGVLTGVPVANDSHAARESSGGFEQE